jgi:hypothetical protein
MPDVDWFSAVFKSFLIASVILFAVSFLASGHATIDALLSGYSTLTISILMILLFVIQNYYNLPPNAQSVTALLTSIGPFLLMIFILIVLLYLVIKYRTIISEGHVSSTYNTFSFISSVLLLVQTYIIFNGISTERFKQTHKLSKITASMAYLVGVLNFISLIILFTVLKYFTTDG